jgi:signal transduction histidine kinase
MPSDFDFRGRFHKILLPPSGSIRAVFEAIANAIDAIIEQSESKPKGHVTITVERDPNREDGRVPMKSENGYAGTPDVIGFRVEDSGVGMTDDNLAHFRRCDTTHKLARGGKGIGRLLWLQVFDDVRVESVYRTTGGLRRRSFPFSVADEGVGDVAEDRGVTRTKTGTEITLRSPKPDRRKFFRRTPQQLASAIIEHFIVQFTLQPGIRFRLKDELLGDDIDLNAEYQKAVEDRHKAEPFQFRNQKFTLRHMLVHFPGARNRVHYCAAGRVADSFGLTRLVGEIGDGDQVHAERRFRYHAYVTGEYLDAIANDERTALAFLPDPETPEDADGEQLTRADFDAEIARRIRQHLDSPLNALRAERTQSIERHVERVRPEYRPFLEDAKRRVSQLRSAPSEREIELLLYEAKLDTRQKLNELVAQLASESLVFEQVANARSALIRRALAESNKLNLNALGEYVCHRRAVLRVLKNNLEADDDGTHPYEEVIHNLVFPMGRTSDDLPVGPKSPDLPEIENLWLLDERLAFHRALASDRAVAPTLNGTTDRAKEPDLAVLDASFVTSDDGAVNNISLVEFKRPGRDDFTREKNPVSQLIEQAEQIRESGVLTFRKKHVSVRKEVLMFGYAVCTLTAKLKKLLLNHHDMKPTPDQIGLYKYYDNINMLIEVIPYDKLVRDAERRNAAFFGKLGVD